MSEKEIKLALIKHIISCQKYARDMLIVNEFTNLNCGVRADIALVENNLLTAFEIKSEKDSTKRLERQVSHYELYFDRNIVIFTRNHADSVAEILKETRSGLWLYQDGKFVVIRRGRKKLISNSIIRNNLISGETNKKIKAPRDILIRSIRKKYAQNAIQIHEKFGDGRTNVDDVNRLNPHYIKRQAAREVVENYERLWKNLSSNVDQSTQSSSREIADRS